jgi:hypothetical protein
MLVASLRRHMELGVVLLCVWITEDLKPAHAQRRCQRYEAL